MWWKGASYPARIKWSHIREVPVRDANNNFVLNEEGQQHLEKVELFDVDYIDDKGRPTHSEAKVPDWRVSKGDVGQDDFKMPNNEEAATATQEN